MSNYSQDQFETDMLLQKIKHSALREMEEKLQKYLKNQFYTRILPQELDRLRNRIIVDIVESTDFFDIKLTFKKEE